MQSLPIWPTNLRRISLLIIGPYSNMGQFDQYYSMGAQAGIKGSGVERKLMRSQLGNTGAIAAKEKEGKKSRWRSRLFVINSFLVQFDFSAVSPKRKVHCLRTKGEQICERNREARPALKERRTSGIIDLVVLPISRRREMEEVPLLYQEWDCCRAL